MFFDIPTYEKETMNSLHSVLFSLWPQSRFQPQKDCFIFPVIAFERHNQDDIFVVKFPVPTACKPETLAAVWSLNETRALPLGAHCQNKVCVCAHTRAWAWMSMSSDYTGVTRQCEFSINTSECVYMCTFWVLMDIALQEKCWEWLNVHRIERIQICAHTPFHSVHHWLHFVQGIPNSVMDRGHGSFNTSWEAQPNPECAPFI